MHVLTRSLTRPLTGRKAFAASLVGAAITAACAHIYFYLPGNPIPVTMQVFAIAACGLVLGSRWGAIAQMEYLAAGLLGAPVFAGLKCGPAALLGPTGGYLLGFAAMAFVIGYAFEHAPRRTFAAACVAGAIGVCVLYTFGVAWLSIWLGPRFSGFTPWLVGALPFIGVDAVKVAAAAAIAVRRDVG